MTGARRLAGGDEQPVQQFGRRLFDALVIDDVRALYLASAQRARAQEFRDFALGPEGSSIFARRGYLVP